MQKRRLGTSGPEVSLVGLGTNNFGGRIDREAARLVVHKALDLGVTLIDTADAYGNKGGSEEILGRFLGPRRKDIVLATKFGLPMDAAGNAARCVAALHHAGGRSELAPAQDRLDRSLSAAPGRSQTPIEETLRALDDLVKAGKVRFIGCSNLSAAQLEEAQSVAARHGLSSFVTCQDEYNLLDRSIEKDRVAVMRKHGLGLLPYFPLASGLLTGKYKSGAPMPAGSRLSYSAHHADGLLNAHNWNTVEKLRAFAAAAGALAS